MLCSLGAAISDGVIWDIAPAIGVMLVVGSRHLVVYDNGISREKFNLELGFG